MKIYIVTEDMFLGGTGEQNNIFRKVFTDRKEAVSFCESHMKKSGTFSWTSKTTLTYPGGFFKIRTQEI